MGGLFSKKMIFLMCGPEIWLHMKTEPVNLFYRRKKQFFVSIWEIFKINVDLKIL